MEPTSIALICAAVFGAVVILASFIRQMMLSRDKQLNDAAQSRALTQEVKELEKMRVQMQNDRRLDSHYKILEVNKVAIADIDAKIEEVLRKKTDLVESYAMVAVKESNCIISGEVSAERKAVCDQLRKENDSKIAFYDGELKQLQERRKSLWDAHTDFEKLLLDQEKARNANLDNVYQQHSALLEKVYLRHIEDTEMIAVKNVEASTTSFKDLIMAPIQFLMHYFGVPSTGVSLIQTRVEHVSRVQVDKAQRDINEGTPKGQEKMGYRFQEQQKKDKEHLARTDDEEQEKEDLETTSSLTF